MSKGPTFGPLPEKKAEVYFKDVAGSKDNSTFQRNQQTLLQNVRCFLVLEGYFQLPFGRYTFGHDVVYAQVHYLRDARFQIVLAPT